MPIRVPWGATRCRNDDMKPDSQASARRGCGPLGSSSRNRYNANAAGSRNPAAFHIIVFRIIRYVCRKLFSPLLRAALRGRYVATTRRPPRRTSDRIEHRRHIRSDSAMSLPRENRPTRTTAATLPTRYAAYGADIVRRNCPPRIRGRYKTESYNNTLLLVQLRTQIRGYDPDRDSVAHIPRVCRPTA